MITQSYVPQVIGVTKDMANKDKTKNMGKKANTAKAVLKKVDKKSGTAANPQVDKVKKEGAKTKAEKPEGKAAKGSVAKRLAARSKAN